VLNRDVLCAGSVFGSEALQNTNPEGKMRKSPPRQNLICTGVLISPWPDQEGNKLIFLSECRELPTAPCLAGGGEGT